MSDLPHGTDGHVGGEHCRQCPQVERFTDQKFGNVTAVQGEHSMVMTNGKLGGWVKTKHGSYVSGEYAKSLNRTQRRKEGINL